MKQISLILTAGVIIFLSSCSGGAKEEKKAEDTTAAAAPAKPVFEPFKVVMITHPVKDFDKWKAGYLSHDSVRKAYGISQFVMGRGLEDSNMVIVIDKMSDVQKAKQFTALPDLKEAMQKAGVTGPPTFDYVDVIRNDDTKIEQNDRIMVVHKVKDFDAWLKVYDNEGVSTRAANGLVDRGLARGIDDPNMVYIVFAVTDMAKAKARVSSEELKKIMTDAGVEGPPRIHFYRLVN
jgi:hypothetical protein